MGRNQEEALCVRSACGLNRAMIVTELAQWSGGNFYDGWMEDLLGSGFSVAMVSAPVSFIIEVS